MRRALILARRGWGRTAPNPMVGAVIARGNAVVAEGWHEEYGALHAEANALATAGDRARGATVYVTLEPCNHVGKTPPCAPALIAAGVARVVFAASDPNPKAGGGAAALRAAGVEVDGGLFADDAIELNAAFHSRFARTRPFITLKLAVSMDGAIARSADAPTQLTGKKAQREVHRMRAAHDAIAVGSGTVIADDPKLTVRGVAAPRVPPARIVFDRRGRLNPGHYVVRTAAKWPTIVAGAADAALPVALTAAGVTHVAGGSLPAALRALHARGIDSILCEGGAKLAGSLLSEGVVDRLVIFRAPKVLGVGAIRAFDFEGHPGATPATRWRVVREAQLDDDLMTVLAPSAESR